MPAPARGIRMNEQGNEGTPAPQPAEPEQHATRSPAPAFKTQFGRVQAAVWVRGIDGRTFYSATVSRSYKDKYDQRQRTTNLDEEDLLPAAKALDEAHTWIQRQRHQAREGAFHELQGPPRAANP